MAELSNANPEEDIDVSLLILLLGSQNAFPCMPCSLQLGLSFEITG